MVRELRLVSPDRPGTFDAPARPQSARRAGTPAPHKGDTSAKSALLEALSREVRTTLALVSGYSQTLLHIDLDDEERARCLTRISSATEHVAELTNEMLSLTTSQDDGRPACQPVAISGLLSQLGRQFAEERDPPRLIAQIPAELPLVSADPLWIVNVLRILIATIGRGSTEERAVQIEARTIGEWVVVSAQNADEPLVKATASPGSPATQRWHGVRSTQWMALSGDRAGTMSHRFDVQVSGEDSSARPGLDFCRQLIEAHGGRIWIEFASGARVSFSLPRYRPEATTPVERREPGGLVGAVKL
ncbi:MAG: histidine kinase dimerization/phospho-acceptor domain-containing protein [Candidatus Limnocylindrales bacterium]